MPPPPVPVVRYLTYGEAAALPTHFHWAARHKAAAASCTAATASPGLSADAEDVAPRTHAAAAVAAASYVAPGRREGAGAATLAGCALAYPLAVTCMSCMPVLRMLSSAPLS